MEEGFADQMLDKDTIAGISFRSCFGDGKLLQEEPSES